MRKLEQSYFITCTFFVWVQLVSQSIERLFVHPICISFPFKLFIPGMYSFALIRHFHSHLLAISMIHLDRHHFFLSLHNSQLSATFSTLKSLQLKILTSSLGSKIILSNVISHSSLSCCDRLPLPHHKIVTSNLNRKL